MPSPLVTAEQLSESLRAGEPLTLLDVRWDLAGGARRDQYLRGHIPGAAFVDLDRELAAPPGAGGRHPLPDPEAFQAAMRGAGVSGSRPVVVYDAGPATAAARAWWLLRYHGHPAVRVLDGGLSAWTAQDGELESAGARPDLGHFVARPGGLPVLDAAGALQTARTGVLIDARAPQRFRGEAEPVDPVAGHIPGARNRPTTANVDPSGCFLAPDLLREQFEALGVTAAARVGSYCGSGVTAAHQLLALELAGFGGALYAGSWSEWIADPDRPVARGG